MSVVFRWAALLTAMALVFQVGNVTSPAYVPNRTYNGNPDCGGQPDTCWAFNASFRSCQNNQPDVEELNGPFALESLDAGISWHPGGTDQSEYCGNRHCTPYRPVQAELDAAGMTASCLAVTDSSGVILPPHPPTRNTSRVLFTLSREALKGNIVIHSDGGGRYGFSTSLYVPGLTEGALAALGNDTLFAVARHCHIAPNSTLQHCIEAEGAQAGVVAPVAPLPTTTSPSAGQFDPNFRLAFSVSTDGGQNWRPPAIHPDLVTPMCQSDLVATEPSTASGSGPTLLVSTPYSEAKGRMNMSVLSSADGGARFDRQLVVWTGGCGYSALVCGLPDAGGDCAIAFDRNGGGDTGSNITFVRFSSRFGRG